MDALGRIKGWIGSLTEIGLMLLALAIVAALLVGANLPFFGNVTANMVIRTISPSGNGTFRSAVSIARSGDSPAPTAGNPATGGHRSSESVKRSPPNNGLE